jgi:hypothetical protein
LTVEIDILIQAMKLLPGKSIAAVLTDVTLESIKSSQQKIEDNADIDDLQEEVTRQEVINKISIAQARALQELAIAKRIDSAEEVEIEEFYEGSGSGGLGVNTSPENLKIGLHGSGSKITRRIYRFKGFREISSTSYEQTMIETESNTDGE